MATLLRIDSSPLGGDASFSRKLTSEFVREWQRNHSGGRVIVRDLATTDLPPVSAAWIGAVYTAETALTPDQRQVLALSNELIGELQAADEYVVGVSVHNLSIPSVLKLWIDQVVRAGKTFSYQGGAPAGLLKDKKATFLVASGGVYEPGTPQAAMNFFEPYLRSIFGLIGVAGVRFINAGGTAKLRSGVDAATILQPALASIHAQFQSA